MSDSPTFDPTRRDLFAIFGATLTVTPALAQHVHKAMGDAKSLDGGAAFKPKFLTMHEYQTVRKLSDLIVPADEHSKGALDSGAAEFIDFLCSRSDKMGQIYTGGLGWMDEEMKRRHGSDFLASKPAQQTALLDEISFKKNETTANMPGVRFFSWCRNMVMDAYYTSPVGIKDLGFMGNTAVAEFSVPEEAVQYALKRSPFANG